MTCEGCDRCKRILHTVSDMLPGDVAEIVSISAEGPLRARILDMGLTKGVKVKLLKKAPLGDPLVLRLRGYELSIRKKEACLIEVR